MLSNLMTLCHTNGKITSVVLNVHLRGVNEVIVCV